MMMMMLAMNMMEIMMMMMMMLLKRYNQRSSSDATKDQVFCAKEADEEGQLNFFNFSSFVKLILKFQISFNVPPRRQ